MSFKKRWSGSGVVAGAVLRFWSFSTMAIATTFGFYGYCNFNIKWRCELTLAWLGGGALAVVEVALRFALLALSGPIGWTIGGVSIATVVSLETLKNKK